MFGKIKEWIFNSGLSINNNWIIFESISDMCDNSMQLFEYMLSLGLDKKYRFFWIVDDVNAHKDKYPEVTFLKRNPQKEYEKNFVRYYTSRAKYCFYTHSFVGNIWKKEQVRCFLTHGTPLKNSKGCFWDVKKNTDIICTSLFASDLRCESFGGGKEKVRILGFPRNDILFAKDDNCKEKLGIKIEEKVILWMPTFKHQRGKSNFKENMQLDSSLYEDQVMRSIDKFLEENHVKLVIKYHPSQDMDFVVNSHYNNILTLINEDLDKENIKPYELLSASDGLITDFSSVYLDYLLINKPIAFDIGDMDKYETGRGFMVDNPLDYMPGNRIYNENDLKEFILDINMGKDKYQREREKIKKTFHTFDDGKSCERIVKYFNI